MALGLTRRGRKTDFGQRAQIFELVDFETFSACRRTNPERMESESLPGSGRPRSHSSALLIHWRSASGAQLDGPRSGAAQRGSARPLGTGLRSAHGARLLKAFFGGAVSCIFFKAWISGAPHPPKALGTNLPGSVSSPAGTPGRHRQPPDAPSPLPSPPAPSPEPSHCAHFALLPPPSSLHPTAPLRTPRTFSIEHPRCPSALTAVPPATCLGTFRQLPHTLYWPAADAALPPPPPPMEPAPSLFMLPGPGGSAAGTEARLCWAPRRSAARAAGRPHPPAAAPAPRSGPLPPEHTPLRAPPIRAAGPAHRFADQPIPGATRR